MAEVVPVRSGGTDIRPPSASPALPALPPAARDAGAAPGASTVRRTVHKRVVTFVDSSRTVLNLDGIRRPRTLVTVLRFPQRSGGRPSTHRRYPLVIFAHGFALSPRDYRRLLYAWADAGYVVAAPAFPGERAGAPGGPIRADLENEPGDLRFVADRLVRAAREGRGLVGRAIDPDRVAVSGHSDGGDAALAVAYDPRERSRRIDAAIILAGADLPGVRPFTFPQRGPRLLAVQGTSDAINPPSATMRYFARAREPKILLTLERGGHLQPYTGDGRQARLLRRVSIAFLDLAFARPGATYERLRRSGARPGLASIG